jgi:DNA/RNA endonuclease G (NUC1)/V8-like Glu-specific endopeptidase
VPEPNAGRMVFNGVDATTGGYLLPPLSAEVIGRLARGQTIDSQQLAELKWRHEKANMPHLGVKAGVDPTRLAEAGWGVIFPFNSPPFIRDALKPLLDHRKAQAGAYYKEFSGPTGLRPDEGKFAFLARNGVGPGPVDPEKVPYYLLIVGGPPTVSFQFQYQLDVQYAVGRLAFESADEYANYARSVVEAETRPLGLERSVVFFAPQNPGDLATSLSSTELVSPLASPTDGIVRKLKPGTPPWKSTTLLGPDATKSTLRRILGGADTPAVLFSASHGVGFPNGDPLQLRRQGALLCQDWPGPDWNQPIPETHYFSQDDVRGDSNLLGLISFFFACYGAGTPHLDDFAHAVFQKTRQTLAPHAFLAGLPQRLLGHPNGGALAVVGHVDRAWGYSFQWENAGRQLQTFEATLKLLLEGCPIGAALDFFNERYAELATTLSSELEDIKFGKQPDDYALAGLWTAHNDSRSYVILGDPAVRVAVPIAGQSPESRQDRFLIAQSTATTSMTSMTTSQNIVSADVRGDPTAVASSPILSVVAATEQRFRERQSSARAPVSYAPGIPRVLQSNPPEQVRKRLMKLGISDAEIDKVLTSGVASFAIIPPRGAALSTARLGLERIIGRNDLIGVEFLTAAVAAARSVARVVIKSGSRIRSYGTGSLVSPRLFLTNHHVLESREAAASSAVEFGFEYAPGGKLQSGRAFALDPDAFFLTDTALDFTLIALKPARELTEFAWLKLNDDDGAVLKDEYVNIIQHPNGQPKQVALRDNQVTDILPSFLHYRADTEPGSSGAPVFNDQWELIGLHHSGVARKNEQGQVMARGGTIWTEDMGDAAIDWIANEGIRVGSLLTFLREAPLPDVQKAARDELLTTVVSPPRAASSPTQTESAGQPQRRESAANASHFPIHIAISLNPEGTPTVSVESPSVDTSTLPTIDVGEAISIDPDYDTRAGYDSSFLGTGSFTVPLPKLPAGVLKNDAAENRQARAGGDRYELPYHHFSVILNSRRRLAFFTAVNIDGRSAKSPQREKDRWYFDPRVDRVAQIGDEFYAKPFDRGHLVRRLDPAWGKSAVVVRAANDDTFHFTNCSPQHARFNEGKNLWAGLEDYLLAKASAEGKRLTVFTGPVFRGDDKPYCGVQIPREFWKVAVYAKAGAGLVAAAFLVSQEDLVKSLTGFVDEEVTAAQVAQTFQVAVKEVEKLTGLDFGEIRNADVLARGGGVSFKPDAPAPRIRLTNQSLIQVI